MLIDPKKIMELFRRKCPKCQGELFKIRLEEIDTVPLSLPADQRVTCANCGSSSVQTVSREVDVK